MKKYVQPITKIFVNQLNINTELSESLTHRAFLIEEKYLKSPNLRFRKKLEPPQDINKVNLSQASKDIKALFFESIKTNNSDLKKKLESKYFQLNILLKPETRLVLERHCTNSGLWYLTFLWIIMTLGFIPHIKINKKSRFVLIKQCHQRYQSEVEKLLPYFLIDKALSSQKFIDCLNLIFRDVEPHNTLLVKRSMLGYVTPSIMFVKTNVKTKNS